MVAEIIPFFDKKSLYLRECSYFSERILTYVCKPFNIMCGSIESFKKN